MANTAVGAPHTRPPDQTEATRKRPPDTAAEQLEQLAQETPGVKRKAENQDPADSVTMAALREVLKLTDEQHLCEGFLRHE